MVAHRIPLDTRIETHSVRDGSCLIWLGAKDDEGYGLIKIAGAMRRAHRVNYERVVGPIPPGLVLHHDTCRRKSCIEPTHVKPVTNLENIMADDTLARRNTRKTHCPKGHPYDEANTHYKMSRNGRPRRACRACQRDYDHERRA